MKTNHIELKRSDAKPPKQAQAFVHGRNATVQYILDVFALAFVLVVAYALVTKYL